MALIRVIFKMIHVMLHFFLLIFPYNPLNISSHKIGIRLGCYRSANEYEFSTGSSNIPRLYLSHDIQNNWNPSHWRRSFWLCHHVGKSSVVVMIWIWNKLRFRWPSPGNSCLLSSPLGKPIQIKIPNQNPFTAFCTSRPRGFHCLKVTVNTGKCCRKYSHLMYWFGNCHACISEFKHWNYGYKIPFKGDPWRIYGGSAIVET